MKFRLSLIAPGQRYRHMGETYVILRKSVDSYRRSKRGWDFVNGGWCEEKDLLNHHIFKKE